MKNEDSRLKWKEKAKGQGISEYIDTAVNLAKKLEPLISSGSKIVGNLSDAGTKILNTAQKTQELIKKREELQKKKLQPITESPAWVNQFIEEQKNKGRGFKIIK